MGTGSAELLLQDVKAAAASLQFYQLCFTAENSWKSCRSQEGIEKGKLREKFLAFSLLSLSVTSPILQAPHKQRKSTLHQMFSKRAV